MSDVTDSQPIEPIGDPQPLKVKDKDDRFWNTLNVLTIIAVGAMIVPAFVVPRRVSGATRSAKLKWQQHQKELYGDAGANAAKPLSEDESSSAQ